MSLSVPVVRVGDPLRHESLSIFPLFTETSGDIEYLLSDEALKAKNLVVEEVSESGSVPTLLVENKGNTRVLFIEGEELIGAKQNRVLNTTVLVAAGSKTKIPVSCVEQGRWRYKSKYFTSSGSHSPSNLRRALKKSVTQSAKASRGHASDQGEVWDEVERQQFALCASSDSMAMSDTFETYGDQLAQFREQLPYAPGATGIAVAIGKKVVALDLFDKPTTCQKIWDRLLSGFVLDALERRSAGEKAEVGDVERLLDASNKADWEQVKAVGEGQEYRTEFKEDQGSALAFDETLIHGSVVSAS